MSIDARIGHQKEYSMIKGLTEYDKYKVDRPILGDCKYDAFGGELLASSYLIKGMTEFEVQEKCGVSSSAAHVQLNTLRRK